MFLSALLILAIGPVYSAKPDDVLSTRKNLRGIAASMKQELNSVEPLVYREFVHGTPAFVTAFVGHVIRALETSFAATTNNFARRALRDATETGRVKTAAKESKASTGELEDSRKLRPAVAQLVPPFISSLLVSFLANMEHTPLTTFGRRLLSEAAPSLRGAHHTQDEASTRRNPTTVTLATMLNKLYSLALKMTAVSLPRVETFMERYQSIRRR